MISFKAVYKLSGIPGKKFLRVKLSTFMGIFSNKFGKNFNVNTLHFV